MTDQRKGVAGFGPLLSWLRRQRLKRLREIEQQQMEDLAWTRRQMRDVR